MHSRHEEFARIARRAARTLLKHHTDCGMTDLAPYPDLLAEYFEIPTQQLPAKSVTDPISSVRADVEVIMESLHGSDFLVSHWFTTSTQDWSRRWFRRRLCVTNSGGPAHQACLMTCRALAVQRA
jgi:hypothetical protein